MKKIHPFYLAIALIAGGLFIFHSSCKKGEEPGSAPQYLSVDFPRLDYKHNLYYLLNDDARSIEMIFNETIDPGSVASNMFLSDKNGSFDSNYDIEISGRAVILVFHQDFVLKDGWKYDLNLKTSLVSTSGESLKQDEIIELRTTGKHLFSNPGLTGQNGQYGQRNSILAISDVHMGDERATDGNYCWFGKNADALKNLLDSALYGNQIRELVIQGDLFDEWIVPYSISPFDPEIGINSSLDYFQAIAESTVNVGIFDRLRSIASSSEIDLIYIPGNHDMEITQDFIEEIIPGIIWKGDVQGLGKYSPVDDIIMEHGHRYDFFNCPQPLVNPNHKLPPGYFISRLYAQGMMESAGVKMKSALETNGSPEFVTAWTLALIYTLGDFNMDVPPLDSAIVLMGGIDGYNDPFSFNGAQNMYKANIQDLWPETQTVNNVPVPMDELFAIWHGYDLTSAALYEYLLQSPSLSPYKIVSFGHSHNPSVQVYPAGHDYEAVYANSGSWLDDDKCSHDVRTYLVLKPAEWTGSDLDVVMLYQYNLDNNGQGNTYVPDLITEENILN
jgi:UDP-2,3-diacylglucosamine pyrophosphatase LpxH